MGALPGFWRMAPDSLVFLRCESDSICRGGKSCWVREVLWIRTTCIFMYIVFFLEFSVTFSRKL